MGRMAYNMDMRSGDPFSLAFEYASGATGERSSIATVKEFGADIVSNAIKNSTRAKENGHRAKLFGLYLWHSLINSLLDSIDDHQMVADAALNYLSAGRDTTAQALTWTFYLLMRHPKVMDEVRIQLSCLISEDLYKATLNLQSNAKKATTLPDGTFLPKNAVLVWCPWAMNRSKITWGEDADDFKPERWLEDGVLISKTAFEFPVFNGGTRTCLGKKMAEVVAIQVIAMLSVNFNFSPINAKERISKNSLTLPMEGGLPCRVSIYHGSA
ncbi:hypothetical protein DID88_007921 [Monilinia fructigena]|uniref:Cytochrome P450 n=1 Tax=Monilinia fructigena TaxID=38457 RepID=A0A395J640_9HELO|nr:hypothetical protein DID88_007921 [Monilinia fructigena]